jgi:hypothetical protein
MKLSREKRRSRKGRRNEEELLERKRGRRSLIFLDCLHTIQVPKSGTDERQAFLAAARIASLNQEFANDLRLCLFRAFASLVR